MSIIGNTSVLIKKLMCEWEGEIMMFLKPIFLGGLVASVGAQPGGVRGPLQREGFAKKELVRKESEQLRMLESDFKEGFEVTSDGEIRLHLIGEHEIDEVPTVTDIKGEFNHVNQGGKSPLGVSSVNLHNGNITKAFTTYNKDKEGNKPYKVTQSGYELLVLPFERNDGMSCNGHDMTIKELAYATIITPRNGAACYGSDTMLSAVNTLSTKATKISISSPEIPELRYPKTTYRICGDGGATRQPHFEFKAIVIGMEYFKQIKKALEEGTSTFIEINDKKLYKCGLEDDPWAKFGIASAALLGLMLVCAGTLSSCSDDDHVDGGGPADPVTDDRPPKPTLFASYMESKDQKRAQEHNTGALELVIDDGYDGDDDRANASWK